MNEMEQMLREELDKLMNPSLGSGASEEVRGHLAAAETAARRIVELFEGISEQNQGLTEEVLTYYEQINTAFHATSSFAHCKSVEEALPVLGRELNRSVRGRFGIYVGPWAPRLLTDTCALLSGQEVAVAFAEPEELAGARSFHERHRGALEQLAGHATEPTAAMVGYEAPYHHDYAGRGNVLVLPLVGPDAQEHFGMILLVRGSDQEPFAALDMGLAQSITRMSVAVLDNITYAHKLQRAGLQTVAALARAMEAKDSYTSGHSSRVAELAVQLGRHIRLSPAEIQTLEWAGQLHDIGKIGIRDTVLNKPGKLTDEEFEHIKSHPVQSCKMLEPIESLRDVIPAVRHHHEHWDGSGYPDGLAGEEIPLLARVLQVADVYDAVTSHRAYRGAMSEEQAVAILRKDAGRILDPNLVEGFLEMPRTLETAKGG